MEEDWTAIEEIHDAARRLELEKAGLPEAFVPLKEAAVSEGLFDYQIDVALLEKTVVGCVYRGGAGLALCVAKADENRDRTSANPACTWEGTGNTLYRGFAWQ